MAHDDLMPTDKLARDSFTEQSRRVPGVGRRRRSASNNERKHVHAHKDVYVRRC